MTLRLYDYRDLDLLMVMDEQPPATSVQLAEVLGVEARQFSARASWMRRFGAFDYDEKLGLWSLAPGGARVVEAHKRAGQATSFGDVPDESLIDAMAHITTRYRHGDPTTAALLRREFLFGTQRGKGKG